MSSLFQSMRFWALVITIYVILILALANSGWFSRPSDLPLTNLQSHILGWLGLFWILYFTIPPFRNAVRSADLHALTAVQTFRVMGVAILVMWGYGLVPGAFALPMSLLDMSVGVMAFIGIRMLWLGRSKARRFVQTLHIWSLADFFLTIVLAIFAWRALPIDPTINPSGYAGLLELPLVAFPAIAIPVFSWASFAALVRLQSSQPDGL